MLSQKLAGVKSGSHIIGIYANADMMLSEALQYLKAGLDNREALLLIFDQPSKEQIRGMMAEQWQISQEAVIELEQKSRLMLRTSDEWYFPEGTDTSRLDAERILRQWGMAVENAIKNGSKGLRAFGNMHYFFEHGSDLRGQLLDYEALLDPHMPFPIIGLCAYESRDIATLSPQQLAMLQVHHSPQWIEGYDVLKHPQNNQCIALRYSDKKNELQAVADYINEGLRRSQLCIYGSVHAPQEDHMQELSSKIVDYDHHLRNGNLLVVNLAPHYISVMCDSLEPFEELKRLVASKVADRSEKHTRIVSDCAGFLFKNKHFDECVTLEKWWKGQRLSGSYVSLYPKSPIDKYPFNIHTFRVFLNHDIVADSDGKVVAEYLDAGDDRSEKQ